SKPGQPVESPDERSGHGCISEQVREDAEGPGIGWPERSPYDLDLVGLACCAASFDGEQIFRRLVKHEERVS
ncbi:MAG: hypothetical protein WBL61_07410, partial [Bryobacteraceae bacterium]